MNLDDLYSEIIVEHSNSKKNKRHLDSATVVMDGKNPSCGDEIQLELKVENGIIEDGSFTGVGCAISQASTSLMIDLVKGKKVEEAREYVEIFLQMIQRKDVDEEKLESLEEAVALKNISNMPARVKCATMPWHTLESSLQEKE